MKFPPYEFKEGLQKGLRESPLNPRNNQRLIESQGMFPEDGVLNTFPDIDVINTTGITAAFPYPQIFILDLFVVACTSTKIYEQTPDGLGGFTWVEKISGLTADKLWSVCDFGTYLVFNNGSQVVIKDPQTGLYQLETDIPAADSMCEVAGQIIVGGL